MKEIILAMMLWIHNATGYTIPEIPEIKFLSTMDLRSYAYGCDQVPIPNGNDDICAARKDWDLDTKSNPINSLRASKELYEQGVRIIIGPVFNESVKYLDELKEITFISLTNKIYGNPSFPGLMSLSRARNISMRLRT